MNARTFVSRAALALALALPSCAAHDAAKPAAAPSAPAAAVTSASDPRAALPSWRDTETKRSLLRFVEEVTTAGSPKFVAPAARVAVFDNDGTLWTEAPLYAQFVFALDHAKALAPQHPEWQKAPALKAALEGKLTSQAEILALLEVTHGNVSQEDFVKATRAWLQTAVHPTLKKPYRELVYVPMLEVLTLLRSRGFDIFVVTGGDVDFARVVCNDLYGIAPDHVVGSLMKLHLAPKGDDFAIEREPELQLLNDGPEKVLSIARRLGRRPIMAFGNSDGDVPMLQYTTVAGGFGLLVHHTDATRELAYDRASPVGKLNVGLDQAASKHFVLADMANDWQRVFAFEPSRTP